MRSLKLVLTLFLNHAVAPYQTAPHYSPSSNPAFNSHPLPTITSIQQFLHLVPHPQRYQMFAETEDLQTSTQLIPKCHSYTLYSSVDYFFTLSHATLCSVNFYSL